MRPKAIGAEDQSRLARETTKRPPRRKADGKVPHCPRGDSWYSLVSVFVAHSLRLPTTFSLSRQQNTIFICCCLAYKPPKAAIHSARLSSTLQLIVTFCVRRFPLPFRSRGTSSITARIRSLSDLLWDKTNCLTPLAYTRVG